jgi:hypothetical protein
MKLIRPERTEALQLILVLAGMRLRKSMLARSTVKPPTLGQVAEWIGPRASAHWAELTEFIASRYPGVFDPTWWFGGKKWGWSLRFKKSKSFCNLIPERGQFKALLVFGADEREKVEAVLPQLSSHLPNDYAKGLRSTTGVAAVVDTSEGVTDIERLLVVKRKSGARDRQVRRLPEGSAGR